VDRCFARAILRGAGGACLVQIVVLPWKRAVVVLGALSNVAVVVSRVPGVISDEEIALDFD